MTINASKHTLGTAASTIVGPSPEPQYVTIKNLQPSADAREYSRHGLVFNAHSKFTIANGGTAHFQMTTGDAGESIDARSTGQDVIVSVLAQNQE